MRRHPSGQTQSYQRPDPPAAKQKEHTKRTADGLPVHSFRTLLADLATVVKNRVIPHGDRRVAFDLLAQPTPLQERAFACPGVASNAL